MSEVDRLLEQYIDRQRAGGSPDPTDLVEQLEGLARSELEELLDARLRRQPRREWNAAAYRESRAPDIVEGLSRSLAGAAGYWPAVLPRFRERARIRRGELVDRLAAALGASDRREKVAGYYHGMEQGLLPAAGVSDRVLSALGEIVGTSSKTLRRAGEAIAPPATGPAEQAVFARTGMPSPGYEEVEGAAGPPSRAEAAEEWDEVDELFRGASRQSPG